MINRVFRVDPRSLAFTRILWGVLLALTFLNFALYSHELISDLGVYPREMSLGVTSSQRFSLLMASGSPLFAQVVLLVGVVSSLLFAAKISPRANLFICWLVFYSVTFRSDEYNFGLCRAMLGALFWGLFIPWSMAPRSPLSRRYYRRSDNHRIFHWAICGLFLICAAVSYGAGLAKFRNFDQWFSSDGALHMDLTYYTNVNPITTLLGANRYITRIMSPIVVLVEMLAPLALIIPFARRVIVPTTLALATIVYFGIALSIHVGIFPLIPLLGFYLFVPSEIWDWISDRSVSSQLTRLLTALRPRLLRVWRSVRVIARLIVGVSGPIVTVAFLILIVRDQTRGVVPEKVASLARKVGAPIFEFFDLRSDWSWIYGGGMRNRFMIVRVDQGDDSAYWNVTSVKYRGVFYDYLMNYSNAILREKRNTEKLLNYSRFLCRQRFDQLVAGEKDRPPRIVRFFDIDDRNNSYHNLTRNDQTVLRKLTEDQIHFFYFNCARNSSEFSDEATSMPMPIKPTKAVDLPLLSWSQEFGVLRYNRSVDGRPLSIRGEVFKSGFGTHANSRVTMVADGFKRFKALAGIDDERTSSEHASVILRVEGDGRELYNSGVLTARSAAVKIDLDITGVRELHLISEDAGKGLNGNKNQDDHVSWGDPVVE